MDALEQIADRVVAQLQPEKVYSHQELLLLSGTGFADRDMLAPYMKARGWRFAQGAPGEPNRTWGWRAYKTRGPSTGRPTYNDVADRIRDEIEETVNEAKDHLHEVVREVEEEQTLRLEKLLYKILDRVELAGEQAILANRALGDLETEISNLKDALDNLSSQA